MFCIALEIGGCKQLEKTENEFITKLLKVIDTQAEIRGGRRVRVDDDYFVLFFETRDAEDSHRVLDTACEIQDTLLNAHQLSGFLMLVEFFPGSVPADAVCRELRKLTSVREIDDSLLLGPQSAGLLRPYCTSESSGGCLRVTDRTREGGPDLGTAAEFCLRPGVIREIQKRLAAYLDCVKAPRLFLIQGAALSGSRYQVDAALKTLGVPTVCRIYPVPGQILPVLDFPGFDEIPQVLQAAEKTLWQEKKALFTCRGMIDFPFEEAFSAFSLAVTAYIRLCEKNLIPAVLVCEEFQAMTETAKKFLLLIFRRNLHGMKLLPVCLALEWDLGEELKKVPIEKYKMPPVGTDEIRFRMQALPEGKNISGLVSGRNAAAGIMALYFGFLAQGGRQEAGDEKDAARDFQPLVRFLHTREKPFREILYVIQETAGLVPSYKLEDFFLKLDFTPAQYGDITRRLADMGIIRDGKSLFPVFPELRRFLRKDSGLRKEKICKELAAFFYALWKRKDFGGGEYLLFNFFMENNRVPYVSEIFQAYLTALLDAGNTEEAGKLLETKFPGFLNADMKLVITSAKLRLALVLNDNEAAARAFSQMDSTQSENPCYGASLIQKTAYWLKRGDRKEALSCAKNAVMLFQEKPAAGGLENGYIAVGLVMLASGAPEQAIDYFLMTRERDPGSVRSIFLEGICRFMMGNYTQAQINFVQVAELSNERYARRWAMAARFMEGKIFFELGEYENAAAVFQLLLSSMASLQYPEPLPVVYAWLARCLIYQGDTKTAARILDRYASWPEAVFFRAEADYFEKEYRKAKDRLQPFLDFPYAGDFFFGDTPAWKDGFYFAENICAGSSGRIFLLQNLIRFFHAYLCGLGTESVAGAEMMSRLICDEKTSRNDFFIRLYYYWYFKILPEGQNTAFEDRLTVLGRATQNLQSLTSKMDSPVHKRSFTGKNYWNRLLMEDARQHNLV